MRALLGLGTNLGNRRANLDRALELLAGSRVRLLELSDVIETAPVGGDPTLPYLNAVAVVEAAPDPWRLLEICKAIETAMGRDQAAPRMAPRVIDIDILDCVGVVITSARLGIPHPRMAGRAFVARPLATLREPWRHAS